LDEVEMSHVNTEQLELSISKDLERVTNVLCEKALNDAREKVHPLIRSNALDRLEKRSEFVQAFKLALEHRLAKKLALWHPGVQAVFKFDGSWMESRAAWDGSIHLLVKVPRLSNVIQALGSRLDRCLLKYLKKLGWSRFQTKRSFLEIQQVTPTEVRQGISYGAMFWAVHSVPVRVWPSGSSR
jgi:hypothetical protein